jgi:hypothetical protein
MKMEVSFYVNIPAVTTRKEAIEWIKFRTGASCSMNISNPLEDYDLEAMDLEVKV